MPISEDNWRNPYFEEGLLARYPNNTKLVEVKGPDENGNRQMLMYESGELLTDEKFSGVVYINETEYEVYSGLEPGKTGIFKIGSGTDWSAETPNQKRNKAAVAFNEELEKHLHDIQPNCFCMYPRIIDYIANRGGTEGRYLFRAFEHSYLSIVESHYDRQNAMQKTKFKCKVCSSEYLWKYQERGIDDVQLLESKCSSVIGPPVKQQAPNFLDALSDKVFCKPSYLYRQNLYESDLSTLIWYLFEERRNNYIHQPATVYNNQFEMDFHYYHYKLGTGIIRYAEMHSSLVELHLDESCLSSTAPFVDQLKSFLLNTDTVPALLQKHLNRGLHFRQATETILVDYPELPLKSYSANYFVDHNIEYGLVGSAMSKYTGHILNEFYSFFYATKHPFSQWHKCRFEVDGLEFNSAEQYMMYSKAKLFGDRLIAEEILLSNDVREQKELGRQVLYFDKATWDRHALDIVYKGNKAKFTQNKEFEELLLSTNGTTLVEASPTDTIWGIGLPADNEHAQNLFTWRGLNWLGIVLTELREELRGNSFVNGYLDAADYKKYSISLNSR